MDAGAHLARRVSFLLLFRLACSRSASATALRDLKCTAPNLFTEGARRRDYFALAPPQRAIFIGGLVGAVLLVAVPRSSPVTRDADLKGIFAGLTPFHLLSMPPSHRCIAAFRGSGCRSADLCSCSNE